ncbi:MAG: TIGR03086 family metal-binding protein [Mobilicoccus sp.]|nr:TIGR03086 family metal-binding protein [Mobilicoccus sp.]
MTTLQRLVPTLTDLAHVLDRIDADDDGRPTPCAEYSVADLRGHVVQWLTAFTVGLEDLHGHCPTDEVGVEDRGGDQVRALADRIAALSDDALPEQVFIGEDGLPLSIALPMIHGEYIVHGWDLAVATEQQWEPDPEVCADLADFFAGALPDEASRAGMFGPAVDVADDAPPLDRLLAQTGRDPKWRS